ncbi:unnamed protein product [Litomosoides sigmodontis]|uniref:Protein-serine O-palmitoleoyltransferase porcupine n=1 Tax=Litomosoides sigmodontis TaxID=42156 RepID=A0A3P6SY48_LITSI|nr:unnamed protein product [Litomosoides sigmodontis]
MSDEERWLYDDVVQLSDEEFADFMYSKETTQEWQQCPIDVLGSLRGTILKLLLFSALKRFLVFLCAKGNITLPPKNLCRCVVEIINCFRALSYITLSLLAVIHSSCIADSFVELPFFGAYFVAQSFRFSHYFVSWLSAGTSLLSGIDSGIVADWIHIELPRSLVDVVISWNIPMHRFLHQYVFGEIKKYGSAAAIFATYAVSSLFHGINFQLSAVLLSLGFYTYAETKMRSKLSRCIDSCVRARKCRKECHHTYKENALSTLAINVVFRVLALTHLVYLGMAFDDSAAETGYSWRHTLSIWANSYYFSHIIGLFSLLLAF